MPGDLEDANYSQASFLLTIRSLASLITLILVLPALTQILMTKFKMTILRRDLWIVRITGIAGILGSMLIALAPNPNVLVLGEL